MILNLDNAALRMIVPNIIHEVEGEMPLFDKLYPWLVSARQWLERRLLGSEFQPEGDVYAIVERIIVNKAFADAAPSIDVAISPAGFTVINTDGRAPASKERVERLVASLNASVDTDIILLCRELHNNAQWRATSIGQWFNSTFIPNFDDVAQFRQQYSLITTYYAMRSCALAFEIELAEHYFGREFLRSLREAFPTFEDPAARDIYELVHHAEIGYISAHLSGDTNVPNSNDVWHLARPILSKLDCYPELKSKWQQEMGERFATNPYKNTKKGGYFF